jgi:hypothetical protein
MTYLFKYWKPGRRLAWQSVEHASMNLRAELMHGRHDRGLREMKQTNILYGQTQFN